MIVPSPIRPRRQVRAILSSTALLSFMSVRKAATLAVAQLGIAAFFVAGTTRSALGESAAWFVLLAAVLAAFVRAIDIEGWALFIPGGVVGRVQQRSARGGQNRRRYRTGRALLLAALAGVVVGQYAATVAVTAIAGWQLTGYIRPEDFATARGRCTDRPVVDPRSHWTGHRPQHDRERHLDWRRHPGDHDDLGRHHAGARRRPSRSGFSPRLLCQPPSRVQPSSTPH